MSRTREHLVGTGALAALVLLLFWDLLLLPEPAVVSRNGADLSQFFLPWRQFGFAQLCQGVIPFWNPFLFCGQPYVGGFQSALFYPVNLLLYLTLPLSRAVNADVALHTLLAGVTMYAWCAERGQSLPARVLGGTLFMLSTGFFLHVYAGHLTLLAAAAWAPLLFVALARWQRRADPLALLWGGAAVGFQVLAGHPQTVFCTALAAGLWTLAEPGPPPARRRAVAGLLAMGALGAALGAVQLLPGVLTSAETVRSGRLAPEFAAMFSLPPENLLTFLAPSLFGDGGAFEYWGRCYHWEVCVHIGVTGLLLAAWGACRDRRARRLVLLAGATLVLALGAHTPLFPLLHGWVPGFATFRVWARFLFCATLFLVPAAAAGFDDLRSARVPARRLAAAGAVLGLLLLAGAGALCLAAAPGGGPLHRAWTVCLGAVRASGESFRPAALYEDASFVRASARHAAGALTVAAAFALTAALLLRGAARRPMLSSLLGLLAAVELLLVAVPARLSFPSVHPDLAPMGALLASAEPEARVFCAPYPNAGLLTGWQDVNGYDTGVLKRYAEFWAFTQGDDPNAVTNSLLLRDWHPLLALLRYRYTLMRTAEPAIVRLDAGPVLPTCLVVPRWRFVDGRDATFAALAELGAAGRLTEEVILEPPRGLPCATPYASNGSVPPATSPAGTVRCTRQSVNRLLLEAETAVPAVLLVTETYSRHWRAVALPGSAQARYEVLPANYTLRGIPLAAGRHRILLRYEPPLFRTGAGVTLAALCGGLAAAWVLRTRRASRPPPPPEALPCS